MPGDAWSPAQYERFRLERRQPFDDLLGLVRRAPGMRVIDLGCGTGELTAKLHERLDARRTLGIDDSPAMLERARVRARPGLDFAPGDIAAFAIGSEYDLVFSNAALQWLPDHERLLARLTRALAPGGQLAVQVPANQDHPAHIAARQLAAEEPFASAMREPGPANEVLAPERYAALLDHLGYAEQHVRLQVYAHRLASRDEVVEWLRGSQLTTFEARLTPVLFAEYLARYRTRLASRLADTRPFFFPFKRILLWARLPGAGTGA